MTERKSSRKKGNYFSSNFELTLCVSSDGFQQIYDDNLYVDGDRKRQSWAKRKISEQYMISWYFLDQVQIYARNVLRITAYNIPLWKRF